MRNARLIYNPAAGRFPAGLLLGRARRVLVEAGWQVDIVEGCDRNTLPKLASEAVRDDCHAVFVVGGDGSVGQVAAELAGSETALGVLPAGTANVWAQELGLPRLNWTHWFALEQAAARLADSQTRWVDICECNGHHFLLWAGIGLDAKVVNAIEPRERWEKIFATAHYATITFWNTLNWEGIDLLVQAQGRTWEGRYFIAVACNIPSYAGGLMDLAPGAKVDDGLLDFWLLGGESIREIVMRILQVFRGTHIDAPGVVHFRAREAIFDSDSDLTMQFDGEPKVLDGPVHFRVHQRALKVLIPRDSGTRVFSPPKTYLDL